jgi:hypothetical protein
VGICWVGYALKASIQPDGLGGHDRLGEHGGVEKTSAVVRRDVVVVTWFLEIPDQLPSTALVFAFIRFMRRWRGRDSIS